jgi:3-oxoacyl-[acyl-carrier protein] reductase
VSKPLAVLTGASGNLGSVLLQRLLDGGYRVVAHSRTPPTAAPAAPPDRTPAAPDLHWVHGDLTDPATATNLATPHINLLINNAASQKTKPLLDLTSDDWQEMLAATLMSAIYMVQNLAPHMPPGSAIVNISSIEAAHPFAGHAHYAAAKAALESLTRSAALELAGRPIRVNAVAPGLIDRPGLATDWPAGYTWWCKTSPLGRPITAQEVTNAVMFLAESQSTGVNGVVLPVAGGWSAGELLSL